MTIFPVDYIIDLSTGEELSIAEFDPERIPEMKNQAVLVASQDVLGLCTRATRETLEDAKHGYDTQLKLMLRTPPVGTLLKNPSHLCAERSDCSMYEISKCTTRNISRDKGSFPECWEIEANKFIRLPDDVLRASRALKTSVIHAWRQGMYAIIVD